jgi:hypothetical protein
MLGLRRHRCGLPLRVVASPYEWPTRANPEEEESRGIPKR